jgi:predicted amidohydrolase YtcJ
MGVNVTALRPRLEHAQLMTKADMQRLGSLGGNFLSRTGFPELINKF